MRWLAVLVVVACSKDAPKQAPQVGESRRLADKMCACRDAACAGAVEKAWNALLADQKLSADDVDKLAAETQRYTQCLTTARAPR